MMGAHLNAMDEGCYQLTLDLAKIKKNREENELRYSAEIKDLV